MESKEGKVWRIKREKMCLQLYRFSGGFNRHSKGYGQKNQQRKITLPQGLT